MRRTKAGNNRNLEWIGMSFQVKRWSNFIGIKCAIAIMFLFDREVSSNQRVESPIKKSRRQTMMLCECQPIPHAVASYVDVWQTMLFETCNYNLFFFFEGNLVYEF